MQPRILCEDGIRVTIGGGGIRTLLTVTNGTSTRFWADTVDLEATLNGMPVQLSAPEAFCHIEVSGDATLIHFEVIGTARKSCSLNLTEWVNALVWVRSQPLHNE